MKVAIIGAGFTGLSAAHYLAKNGASVVIFESSDNPGGLALGFKEKKWDWTLEHHYHHWFTSDTSILNLAKELNHKVIFVKPKTSTYVNNNIYQVDSPKTLLRFDALPIISRLRTAVMLTFLKVNPWWKMLESISAHKFILKTGGRKSWEVLWGPLFTGKFGRYAKTIPASWFWTRINKRSMSLGYPSGGFLEFAKRFATVLINQYSVSIEYNTSVLEIKKHKDKLMVITSKGSYLFDKVICTLPSPAFLKITKGLNKKYIKSMKNLKGLGAINLVLSIKNHFFADGTYWLNVNDLSIPFLAIVEHTNFMSDKKYGNEHLIYIGNYLPQSHDYFMKSESDLINEFLPHLAKINPKFKRSWIKKSYLFKAPFAQPIIPKYYSKSVPSFETPIDGLYLCNMQQVYPYDRGTNYAVELGEKVAKLIISNENKQN